MTYTRMKRLHHHACSVTVMMKTMMKLSWAIKQQMRLRRAFQRAPSLPSRHSPWYSSPLEYVKEPRVRVMDPVYTHTHTF